MSQNLRGHRPRRFGHNLLTRGGLRAYALTLPLLGFKCTLYEIKSRDMNEKGKDFISYNKPYMPSAGLHGPLHMVHCTWCVHSVHYTPPGRDLYCSPCRSYGPTYRSSPHIPLE